MSHRVTLISSDKSDIELKLLDFPVNLTFNEKTVTVYQDEQYILKFIKSEFGEEFSIETIMINKQEISFRVEKQDEYIIVKLDALPFMNIYGLTDISIQIKCGNERIMLFSTLLAVAIKQDYKETMISVHEMLNDIYLKEHHLLQTKGQSSIKFLNQQRRDNKYSYEINLLKNIIKTLNENYIHFLNYSNTTPKSMHLIDNFEKIRSIDNKIINHIVSYPSELKQVPYHTGICYNEQNFFPQKTLVNTIYRSKETFENHVIISFLNSMESIITKKMSQLKQILHNDNYIFFNDENIKNGYMMSYTIIEQYLKIAFQEYYNDLNLIYKSLLQIIFKYKQVLPNNKTLLMVLPKPTTIFLEIHHYKNIYTSMVSWFSIEDISIPSSDMLLHFYSADRIYEYYSLINFIDVLIQLGWNENISKRSYSHYDLKDYHKYAYNKSDNTFSFYKQNHEITLYYQPVVFSDKTKSTNSIDLVCVEKNQHYAPDFIVKIINKSDGNVNYGIFDSKWRNKAVLQKKNNTGGFAECIYKYQSSIISITNEKIDFMWLLQGKDDNRPKIYLHNSNSDLTHFGDKFIYSSGIVSLTPKSGTESFKYILNKLISL